MFPSDDALLPEQLDLQQTQRLIIIDSKWAKARELNQHPALQGMPRVRRGSWRRPQPCRSRQCTAVLLAGLCLCASVHMRLLCVALACR